MNNFSKINPLNFWAHLRILFAKVGLLRPIRESWLWRIKHRKAKKTFNNSAMEVFWEVDRICKINEISIFPAMGTLLGIEREDGLLKHDLDLDFGVFYDSEAQQKIHKEFIENGFKLITRTSLKSSGSPIEEKYNFLDMEVDIFYFTEEDGKCIFYDLETDTGLSIEEEQKRGSDILPYKNVLTKFNLQPRIFKDKTILVPSNLKDHLKELYGEAYLVPDINWRQSKRKSRYLIADDRVELEVFRN